MKLNVISQQFNTATFERIGKLRTEEIDTETDLIFWDCENLMDVKSRYENFWNGTGYSPVKVLVKTIELIEK
jgi:hypothetical protein